MHLSSSSFINMREMLDIYGREGSKTVIQDYVSKALNPDASDKDKRFFLTTPFWARLVEGNVEMSPEERKREQGKYLNRARKSFTYLCDFLEFLRVQDGRNPEELAQVWSPVVSHMLPGESKRGDKVSLLVKRMKRRVKERGVDYEVALEIEKAHYRHFFRCDGSSIQGEEAIALDVFEACVKRLQDTLDPNSPVYVMSAFSVLCNDEAIQDTLRLCLAHGLRILKDKKIVLIPHLSFSHTNAQGHWVVFVILVEESRVLVYDPLFTRVHGRVSTPYTEDAKVVQDFCEFFYERPFHCEEEGIGWMKQKSSEKNCGVYTYAFMKGMVGHGRIDLPMPHPGYNEAWVRETRLEMRDMFSASRLNTNLP